jgi:hypothetical protein
MQKAATASLISRAVEPQLAGRYSTAVNSETRSYFKVLSVVTSVVSCRQRVPGQIEQDLFAMPIVATTENRLLISSQTCVPTELNDQWPSAPVHGILPHRMSAWTDR